MIASEMKYPSLVKEGHSCDDMYSASSQWRGAMAPFMVSGGDAMF